VKFLTLSGLGGPLAVIVTPGTFAFHAPGVPNPRPELICVGSQVVQSGKRGVAVGFIIF